MQDKPAIEGGKPVRKKPLVFGKPFIEKKDIRAVVSTLESGWVGQGPKTEEFEKNFKEFIGSEYAVAVSSCTAGLHLSLLAVGCKAENEVITSPLGFASTVNSIMHTQAKPVFADIDKETLNINPDLIGEKLTGKTKAILPVHFCGQPCEMKKILEIAEEKKVSVIEDAAHATGSVYNQKKIGAMGALTCFSFAHNKIITTIEGGMITSNDTSLVEKTRFLRQHGFGTSQWERFRSKKHIAGEIIMPGFKYYMNDTQAAMGLEQLKSVEKILSRKDKIAKIYTNAFKNNNFVGLQKHLQNTKHSNQFYPLVLQIEKLRIDRDRFVNALRKENIFASTSFSALHLNHFYRQEFGFQKGNFPNAEYASERIISLPLNNDMEKGDAMDVVKAVEKLIDYYKK